MIYIYIFKYLKTSKNYITYIYITQKYDRFKNLINKSINLSLYP